MKRRELLPGGLLHICRDPEKCNQAAYLSCTNGPWPRRMRVRSPARPRPADEPVPDRPSPGCCLTRTGAVSTATKRFLRCVRLLCCESWAMLRFPERRTVCNGDVGKVLYSKMYSEGDAMSNIADTVCNAGMCDATNTT